MYWTSVLKWGYLLLGLLSGAASSRLIFCVHSDERVFIATPLDSPASLFLGVVLWCVSASSGGSTLPGLGQFTIALGMDRILTVGPAEHADQIVECPANVDVRDIDVPMLVGHERLSKPGSFAPFGAVPTLQGAPPALSAR